MRKISSVASIEEFFKFIVLKICIIIHDLIVNFVLGFKNQNHEYHLVCVCVFLSSNYLLLSMITKSKFILE